MSAFPFRAAAAVVFMGSLSLWFKLSQMVYPSSSGLRNVYSLVKALLWIFPAGGKSIWSGCQKKMFYVLSWGNDICMVLCMFSSTLFFAAQTSITTFGENISNCLFGRISRLREQKKIKKKLYSKSSTYSSFCMCLPFYCSKHENRRNTFRVVLTNNNVNICICGRGG